MLCDADDGRAAGGFDHILANHGHFIDAQGWLDLHEQLMQQAKVSTSDSRDCGNSLAVGEVSLIQGEARLLQ
jgi:hypothetical protein